ncbi:Murein DD-endopeptidase MepM and murein hydrolase activator NlpD, contain LysM domain [Geodermatophilus pulveris]|uniref:Murein DD-endopeptidase MepM and murein hydrolase activator NlpD, contain LysM domain n=1 Tax=Geodermatophilus pulveris TaxID=1564159 RepID=A0A239EF85_9ACTN|nr:M23 family metallopeptidase [Geodermatophilus pulveris]SNS42574.1 Murein DD-endopeptidase MepM and murein hydrolase activator NlpD, contain LysM domain [Geodermatophilus pulveris]
MATLHRLHTVVRCATSPRSPLRAPRRAAVVAAAVAGLLAATPVVAGAAPAPAEEQASLEEQVAGIEEQVRAAEEQLQRMTVEAEAAADAALVARAQLAAGQTEAERTAAELAVAQADVAAAEADIADLGREAYMGADDRYGDLEMLLDADSPTELLQQAATMEVIGDHRAARLQEFLTVAARLEQADKAAQAAVARLDELARTAAEAEQAANAHLAQAQADYDARAAEKARLEEELRRAGERLLAAQGAADAAAAWGARQAQQQQTLAVASGSSAGMPTAGRVTSCYGPRWGTMHQGIDIAAPIGTPIYVPEGGVVLQAGPASGFGQAVYVRHGDGQITLYGHVDQFFVSAGQVVSAGEHIADVGNKGQSTGPHLHFEVHRGGLYASRVDPMPWLQAHGISLGGAC